MMKQIFFALLCSFSLLMLAACGDSNSHTNTSATLKVNLSGDLAGKAISGASFTLPLPANVTPVTTSVVTPTGTFAGSTITPVVTYTPATATVPGTLLIVVTSSAPAGVTTAGEVATISLQLANDAAPTAANFPLSGVSVIDTLGVPITGVTATVSGVTLQ